MIGISAYLENNTITPVATWECNTIPRIGEILNVQDSNGLVGTSYFVTSVEWGVEIGKGGTVGVAIGLEKIKAYPLYQNRVLHKNPVKELGVKK